MTDWKSDGEGVGKLLSFMWMLIFWFNLYACFFSLALNGAFLVEFCWCLFHFFQRSVLWTSTVKNVASSRLTIIVCLTIVALILIATFRPHTAVLHQAIVSIYWVEPFVPPWLLVIGVSQTLLRIGGFRSKALLALWEEDTDLSAVRCGRGRLSCCLKSTVSLSSDQTIGKFVVLEFLSMNSYWISLAALLRSPYFS